MPLGAGAGRATACSVPQRAPTMRPFVPLAHSHQRVRLTKISGPGSQRGPARRKSPRGHSPPSRSRRVLLSYALASGFLPRAQPVWRVKPQGLSSETARQLDDVHSNFISAAKHRSSVDLGPFADCARSLVLSRFFAGKTATKSWWPSCTTGCTLRSMSSISFARKSQ